MRSAGDEWRARRAVPSPLADDDPDLSSSGARTRLEGYGGSMRPVARPSASIELRGRPAA